MNTLDDHATSAGLSRIPERWRPWVIGLFAAVGIRLLLLPLAWSAAWLMASGDGPLTDGIFEIWRRWDGIHFLTNAEFGYSSPVSDAHATQWWPGLPLAIDGLMKIGFSALGAGMLTTTACSIVAFTYLYRTAEEDLGEGTGWRAVMYLALFPTSLFLVAPYSEALFLAGAIPAFYYVRRERWVLAGPFAALAMSSRMPGAFVLIGMAAEFLRQNRYTLVRMRDAFIGLAIGVTPFIGYAIFLANARSDPFYFVVDADAGWGRHFVGPVNSFLNTLRIADGQPTSWIFAWRLEIVASALMVAVVVWTVRRREWDYAAFTGGMAFLLLSTTWYFSHPRMLLMFFPGALALASLTRERRWLHEALLVTFTLGIALGTILFTRGFWFF